MPEFELRSEGETKDVFIKVPLTVKSPAKYKEPTFNIPPVSTVTLPRAPN